MENQPTNQHLEIEATITSGKAWLERAFRFAYRLRELNRDHLASYYKFKVCRGLKQPAVKWTDPRNHQKEPINTNYYNTGILTGPINNLLVVDVDVKEQGMEEFRKYIDSYGSPNTLTVSTPSGGLHLYFNYHSKNPQDAEKIKQYLRNTTGFRGKGIDIRSEGGYIVAPPSVVSKKPYKIINNTAVVDIPSNLIDWLIKDEVTPKRGRIGSTKSPPQPKNGENHVKEASENELEDIKKLCDCLATNQIDNYSTWIRIGMILKQLGAPLALWEEVSRRGKKYKNNDCSPRWEKFNPKFFTIGSLIVLAKAGNLELYNQLRPNLHMNQVMFHDDEEYKPVVIDTPFLLPKQGEEPTPDQKTFIDLSDKFVADPRQKTMVVRSRYGSGKTYYLQQLIKKSKFERVLFITYRQTLARDIDRNFKRLGFKNYLDAPDHPEIWNAKKLIVQLDSLLNVINKNDKYIAEGLFEKYDMIILDESESLLNHFDEKTMENKEIEIFNFFDTLLTHTNKIMMMDGDISRRSLSFAKHYGNCTYIKNMNHDGSKVLNIYLDEERWAQELEADLVKYHQKDPNFKVAICCQSSSRAHELQESLQAKFPQMKVSKLLGTDSSETKRIYLEDINESLDPVNVFIYSPVIESGVDITVKVEKVYGFICSRSNSPRAFLQMLARCRNVVDPNISILRDSSLKINKNFNFWRFEEVMELNRLTVENTKPELVINGEYLERNESNRDARRKTVSIYNEVEKLNKNPSVFINYLRVLASGKGMAFNIIGNPEDKPKVSRAGSYKVSCTMEAEDIDSERYEELSLLRKAGKTTTEENYMIDKHFYQNHLLLKHLDKNILKEFMFNPSLLKNFTSLVDVKNHEEQDNLKSAKLLKQVEMLSKLIEGLGFASSVDQQTVVPREDFMTNWVCNIVDDDAFKDHQNINQLFDLRKTHQISEGMESKQILAWVNCLGKPFSIAVRAVDKHGGGYRLEVQNEMLELIKRKNNNGKFYQDGKNLLKQENKEGDPFIDEETGETLYQKKEKKQALARNSYDTSRLDVGIDLDD